MKANVLVIGAGIIGLSIAYNLVKKGERDVVVIDRKYVGSGSTTRCASGFRIHFFSDENTLFAIEARKRLMKAGDELEFNPLVEPIGYMWLLYDDAMLDECRKSNIRWSQLGVAATLMTPEDVIERHPYINTEGMIGALYGPQDGELHHDFLTFGYRDAILKRGGKILEYVDAKKLLTNGSRIKGVETSATSIEADKVVVAGGAWSSQILQTVGVRVPITPERKEICVMEPMKHFIKPLLINTKLKSFYITQTARGEAIGGMDHPIAKESFEYGNTLEFLKEYSRAAMFTIPALRKARVLRVWSGFYEVTPDHSHILGRSTQWPENLYVCAGFSGHGLLMAPFAGEAMADLLLEDKTTPLMQPFRPSRFDEGKQINEELVIG
jgi:sarcosine oxidase subunit beta